MTLERTSFRNGQADTWASVVSASEWGEEGGKEVFLVKTRIYLILRVSLTTHMNFRVRKLTTYYVLTVAFWERVQPSSCFG